MPIDHSVSIDLFDELSELFDSLLGELEADDWLTPIPGGSRTVGNVVAHLLDGTLRRIAIQRDHHVPPGAPANLDSAESIKRFVDNLNQSWEYAASRLSHQQLRALHAWAAPQLSDLFGGLESRGEAIFPVSWAGEETSYNCFDIAREYTEKWYHHRQIEDALGLESRISIPRFYTPYLDTLRWSMPQTFQAVDATAGTTVCLTVSGKSGGAWIIESTPSNWRFVETATNQSTDAECIVPQDYAWSIFARRAEPEWFRERCPEIELNGNETLAAHVLRCVSFVA